MISLLARMVGGRLMFHDVSMKHDLEIGDTSIAM